MSQKKLQEELERFRSINKYADKLIMEQDAPPPPGGDLGAPPPPPGDAPPPPGGDLGAPPPPPGGAATPPPSGGDTTADSEEIDITDLVNMTKSVKKDIEDNKQDHTAVLTKMEDVFTKLNDLEQKLSQMDRVMDRINSLDGKIDSIREKRPEEKLEMRSLDSYPFNQNPQQFFVKKQDEMRKSGKNEYILTKDEIENYSNDTIRQSFNPDQEEDEYSF
jgi:hypothetical protein